MNYLLTGGIQRAKGLSWSSPDLDSTLTNCGETLTLGGNFKCSEIQNKDTNSYNAKRYKYK